MRAHRFMTGILSVSLVTFIASCNNQDKEAKRIEAADTIAYETRTYDIPDTRYSSDPALQTHFKVTYPDIIEKVPSAVKDSIAAHIAAFIEDSETPVQNFPKIEQQAQKLFDEYAEVYAEFKNETSWLVDKQVKIEGKLGNLLSISFSESSYKGGAHPNSSTIFKVFDLTNGKVISLYQILDPAKKDQLNALRLKTLNDMKESAMPGGEWKTYMFNEAFEPAGNFNTNENFSLTKDSIQFFYNSYDIAAYAFGPTSLKIPLSEIKPFVNPKSEYARYLTQ